MPRLRIYPKRGRSFTVEVAGVEYTDTAFVLINANSDPSEMGFISMNNVAAIVPEAPIDYGLLQNHYFKVYLQGRDSEEEEDHPISIGAHLFDLEDPPSVRFYRVCETPAPPEILPNIYVAISEVVAILPSNCCSS